jgi:predicted DNA-binding transcriptional regulator AlpA
MASEPKELSSNEIVRWKDGPKYFGFKRTVLNAKIRSGEIPEPMPLSDTGRATGWLGRVILEWQASRLGKPRRPSKTRKGKGSAHAAA